MIASDTKGKMLMFIQSRLPFLPSRCFCTLPLTVRTIIDEFNSSLVCFTNVCKLSDVRFDVCHICLSVDAARNIREEKKFKISFFVWIENKFASEILVEAKWRATRWSDSTVRFEAYQLSHSLFDPFPRITSFLNSLVNPWGNHEMKTEHGTRGA